MREYLEGPFSEVFGWCLPELWQVIEPIDAFQRSRGIEGPIAEIGVLHGKFFIGLLKTKPVRPAYAIDLFSLQRPSFDFGGRGNINQLRANIAMCGENPHEVRILERDSLEITREDIARMLEETGGFAMFSVDGCHSVEHTINDIRIAMQVTRPGGIIFVDDYYNANWPGVQEGVSKLYLSEKPPFIPLLACSNKLILCEPDYHADYLACVAEFVATHYQDTRVKPVTRFGFDNLTVTPAPDKEAHLAPERRGFLRALIELMLGRRQGRSSSQS